LGQLQPAIPVIHVNYPDDPQDVVVPPADVTHCPAQDSDDGGCAINALDGTIDNTFDASASIDPNSASNGDTVVYQWQIFYPSIFGDKVLYSSSGITGYETPVLHMQAGSLPELDGDPRVGADIFWRVDLKETIIGPGGVQAVTEVYFRFAYSSDFSLQISSDCQLTGQFMGLDCVVIAQQLLSVGDQGLRFTSTAPAHAVVGGPAYLPTTTSLSGRPVTLSIDKTSLTVCTLDPSGTSVSFIGTGTCTIDASQTAVGVEFYDGYWAADLQKQTFQVAAG
jgi:hypothetical protein